jgi:hypothetical protein
MSTSSSMSTSFITNLKNQLAKHYIVTFFIGIAMGVLITSFAFLTPQVLTSYRLDRIRRAYGPELSDENRKMNEYRKTLPEQSETENRNVLENEKLQAAKNQTKWDDAKKTGDFKALAEQILNQGGEVPQPGDCIYNIDPKHNPNITISKSSIKNTATNQVSGSFRSNFILGLKAGSNGASKGDDIIGYNLEFTCQKLNPKYSMLGSFGPDGFIKVNCDEIMFLSANFRQKLQPEKCARMRDNASFWIFRDTNDIEYSWSLLGAKEIKDTLQLEIDYK